MSTACHISTSWLIGKYIYKLSIVFDQYSVLSFCHNYSNLRQDSWGKSMIIFSRSQWCILLIYLQKISHIQPSQLNKHDIEYLKDKRHGLFPWSSQRVFTNGGKLSVKWICCFSDICSAQQRAHKWGLDEWNLTKTEAVIGEQLVCKTKGTLRKKPLSLEGGRWLEVADKGEYKLLSSLPQWEY